MFPISYSNLGLILILYLNKEQGKKFYPFVAATSIIGIPLVLLIMFSPKIRNMYYKILPNSVGNYVKWKTLYFIQAIISKILLLYYWPIDLSETAFKHSIGVFVFWLFLFIVDKVIKN